MIKSPSLPLSPNGSIPPKINPFSGHHYSNYKYYKESRENPTQCYQKQKKNPFETEPSYAAERFTAKTKSNFSKCKFVVASKDSSQFLIVEMKLNHLSTGKQLKIFKK